MCRCRVRNITRPIADTRRRDVRHEADILLVGPASVSGTRLDCSDNVSRGMALGAVAECFDQIMPAIPVRVAGRLGLDRRAVQIEKLPEPDEAANRHRKVQLMRRRFVPHRLKGAQIGRNRHRAMPGNNTGPMERRRSSAHWRGLSSASGQSRNRDPARCSADETCRTSMRAPSHRQGGADPAAPVPHGMRRSRRCRKRCGLGPHLRAFPNRPRRFREMLERARSGTMPGLGSPITRTRMFRAARAKTAGTTALISEEQANFSSRRGCALKQNTFARPVSEAIIYAHSGD